MFDINKSHSLKARKISPFCFQDEKVAFGFFRREIFEIRIHYFIKIQVVQLIWPQLVHWNGFSGFIKNLRFLHCFVRPFKALCDVRGLFSISIKWILVSGLLDMWM